MFVVIGSKLKEMLQTVKRVM